jgi:hypothetical protein
LIDETGCRRGIGEARTSHDEPPRSGEAPADEVAVRRRSQDHPKFARQRKSVEAGDRLKLARGDGPSGCRREVEARGFDASACSWARRSAAPMIATPSQRVGEARDDPVQRQRLERSREVGKGL